MDGVEDKAGGSSLATRVDELLRSLEEKVIGWRRDIHANPELGNREFRTARLVADHLSALGLDVSAGVAYTGVVGLLRGAKPGPVVALRADMDALPVVEEVDLPFASKARAKFNGEEVGVMHACGHDCHTAILMGLAEVFASIKQQLPGSIKFIFQPAEEGAPDDEEGGAKLMIDQGVLENPTPNAIFGLHVTSILNCGMIGYRPGPAMASADNFQITVHGRQTHAGMPWRGVDPIVTAAQVILSLQTIVSRQVDITREPCVVTVGSIRGGVRENIIPDMVDMKGTIRTFDEGLRTELEQRVTATAEGIACACGAKADVRVKRGYPVTVNHPKLTEWGISTLKRVAGDKAVLLVPKIAGSEDFSYYQQRIPGFFYFVGVTPVDKDASIAATNHSPRFFVDDRGLLFASRTLAHLAVDFLSAGSQLPFLR